MTRISVTENVKEAEQEDRPITSGPSDLRLGPVSRGCDHVVFPMPPASTDSVRMESGDRKRDVHGIHNDHNDASLIVSSLRIPSLSTSIVQVAYKLDESWVQ